MTNPITPPPELVEQWLSEHYGAVSVAPGEATSHVATQAAQWGADQELEACCKQVAGWQEHWECKVERLRVARRPKPPSLKEQALKAVAAIEGDFNTVGDRAATIRRALEALDD